MAIQYWVLVLGLVVLLIGITTSMVTRELSDGFLGLIFMVVCCFASVYLALGQHQEGEEGMAQPTQTPTYQSIVT